MRVNSQTVCFVLDPLPIVNIAVRVDKSAVAMSFVVFPVAFVHGAVGPDLNSTALSNFLTF